MKQVKKRMVLTLHYWSPTHIKVWVHFDTSFFFGNAEGNNVASKTVAQMAKDGFKCESQMSIQTSEICKLITTHPYNLLHCK